MNKKIILGVAAAALVGLASCNCNNSDKVCPNKAAGNDNDKEVLYSGILPNADAQGTVYTLKLEFDADDNYNEGDFTLVENSLATDTVAASGLKILASSYSKGDFRKEAKQVDGTTINYVRLMPDAKDALGNPSNASMYFIINEDESLTMVNAELQRSETPGLDYTLSVVK
ncbi:MAG: hypothetical protein K2M03_06100 [Muribaculaceae bacterium]|nr:hypothetical protein [Muribaculaceae bacterium]MDE6295620.1 hypothetical protein [Muribaculaceae bacterium]